MLKPDDRASTIVIVLYFAAAFGYLLMPLAAEHDFWWHLSTGKWIWEHRGVPSVDPFSLFLPPASDPLQVLTLKGFWLSQTIYFLLYSATGAIGICLLGAATLLATLVFVWRILMMHGVSLWRALWCMLPLTIGVGYFTEHRPQLFSFLFFALVLFLLERGEAKFARSDTPGGEVILIPLVVLVWAQMHSGYAAAIPLVTIYALTWAWRRRTNGMPWWPPLLVPATTLAAGVAAPAGPDSLFSIFTMASSFTISTDSYGKNIVDYHRPWEVAFNTGPWFWRILFTTMLGSALALLLFFRKIPARITLLVCCYLLLALTAFRFAPFFFIAATPLLAIVPVKLPALRGDGKWLRRAAVMLPLVMMSLLATGGFGRGMAHGPFREGQVSEQALNFLLERKIPGLVGNPYVWGGYMMWRVWPQYSIFMDQRNLAGEEGFARYTDLMFMADTSTLDRFRLNSVIMNMVDPGTTSIYYGFITLMESEQWDLVYYDTKAALFVRSGMSGLPPLKKSGLESAIEQNLAEWQRREPGNPAPCLLQGQFFFWHGDLAAARQAFGRAEAIAPGNAAAREWLEAVAKIAGPAQSPR